MRKLLLTAFEPFGNVATNSSYEVVQNIESQIKDFEIIKEVLKVEFENKTVYHDLIEKYHPDVILHCGQAGGRGLVEIEDVAVNVTYSTSPDNLGVTKSGERIFEDGPVAYFSSLPVFDLVNKLQKENLPIRVSFSAGTYICNLSFYSSSYYINQHHLNIKVGFIHFPFYKNQVEEGKYPTLELETMVSTLRKIILEL